MVTIPRLGLGSDAVADGGSDITLSIAKGLPDLRHA